MTVRGTAFVKTLVSTNVFKRGSLFALILLSGCAQVLQAGFDPLSWRSGGLRVDANVPLWIVANRDGDDRGFVGATELSADGESRPIIIDITNSRHRCDGLLEPAAAPYPGVPLDITAHISCTNGDVILARFAFSGLGEGQGIGRDANGRRYQFSIFARDEEVAENLSKRIKKLRADAAPPSDAPPLLRHASERVQRANRRNLLNSRLRDLRSHENAVPRYLHGTLPKNLSKTDPKRRKATFLRIVLPIIAQSNEVITKDRAHMLVLLAKLENGSELSALDRIWLHRLSRRYRTTPNAHATLRYRVDTVPASLAIAQAALETGWGRSRFANSGNALYGEWTFGTARGIVPSDRPENADHKIRSFDNLLHSVSGYMNNLNSHRAYRRFRSIRANARASGETADSRKLAKTLRAYGKGDPKYTTKLSALISANRLREFDDVRLAAPEIGVPWSAVPTPRKKPKGRFRVAANASDGPWWSVRKWLK